jgi:hypothetical protein
LVTFEPFLPALREGIVVDVTSLNGVANETFLTGDVRLIFTAERPAMAVATTYARILQ